MKCIVMLACLVAAASADNLLNHHQAEWRAFKTTHGKSYGSEVEERHRLLVFLQNRARILEHNRQHERGLVSYRLAVNQFADLTHHEFNTLMNGYNNTSNEDLSSEFTMLYAPSHVQAPADMDWRAHGAVTQVKNQGTHCGSCWSFSTTGSLGHHFRKTGQLVSLSEQNLIDCSWKYGNKGCHGGWMNQAFMYIRDNGGIDTEQSYPYMESDNYQCRYNPSNIGATVTGVVSIPSGDEHLLMQAVAQEGPVAVAIDAKRLTFYAGGVFYDPYCSSRNLNHAVLVVGYGTDPQYGDYWLVKNSWGTNWGEQGYVRIAGNRGNHCGIASKAFFPQVLVVGYGTDERSGDYWLVKNSWGTTWGDQGYIKMARNVQNHCGIATQASYPLGRV